MNRPAACATLDAIGLFEAALCNLARGSFAAAAQSLELAERYADDAIAALETGADIAGAFHCSCGAHWVDSAPAEWLYLGERRLASKCGICGSHMLKTHPRVLDELLAAGQDGAGCDARR